MARNLLAESPIDTVIPISFSTLREKRASDFAGLMPCTRAVPARSMKASSIEIGSTSGVRSSIRRRTSRDDLGIFRHVGRNDRRMRAQAPRLEHRHRRAHAEGAGEIAGGGDDAALAAADDQRLVGERRIVALFDRGVEGVAIDMRERQVVEFGMTDEAGRAATGATRAGLRRVGQAIAAEAGRHGTSRS